MIHYSKPHKGKIMAKDKVEAPKVIGAKEYGKGKSQADAERMRKQDEGVVAKPFKTVKEKIAK